MKERAGTEAGALGLQAEQDRGAQIYPVSGSRIDQLI